MITYIRTDSQRISDEAQEHAKEFILESYGSAYFKKYVNQASKGKKIQDAHECISATYINMTPDSIRDS